MGEWLPVTAAKVRPNDVIRGCVHEPGDPPLTVRIVDRCDGSVFLHCDGQPEPLVFAPAAPLEYRAGAA